MQNTDFEQILNSLTTNKQGSRGVLFPMTKYRAFLYKKFRFINRLKGVKGITEKQFWELLKHSRKPKNIQWALRFCKSEYNKHKSIVATDETGHSGSNYSKGLLGHISTYPK